MSSNTLPDKEIRVEESSGNTTVTTLVNPERCGTRAVRSGTPFEGHEIDFESIEGKTCPNFTKAWRKGPGLTDQDKTIEEQFLCRLRWEIQNGTSGRIAEALARALPSCPARAMAAAMIVAKEQSKPDKRAE